MGQKSIFIKNMVCPRCIEAVNQIFQELRLSIVDIKLGKVTIKETITSDQKNQLKEKLVEKGFELLGDTSTKLVSEIKSIIIETLHYKNEPTLINVSTLLTQKLGFDYAYLSRLFSSEEGQTIQQFVMAQKIEKVKELLTYGELNLSEIAYQMNYSSSAHLSNQFKKITGLTPSGYKDLHNKERKSLDDL
ncbi:MAG: AraC family transcriptional regulator [Bacteroidetes bacterium]|nr:MAG: AraC family transcriptional regulator [Bacteroidota bacterium]